MINNKTLLALSLTLFASLLVAGCGTQATPETAQNTDAQETFPTATTENTEAPAPTEVPPEATATEVPTEVPTEAPTETPPEASTSSVSFANDVYPIIDSRCINCHGGERIEEGLVMFTYADIMAGSDNGPVIVPGDPTNSLLVELVADQKMPKRGPKLTPSQVQIISDWVAGGALNN